MVLSSALTLGVVGVLVLAGTAPGASALRAAANNLTVTAHAAGGGGGGVGMNITIVPTASLTARLAATTLVSYTCQPVNGETFLAANVFVQVSERTSGKTVAQGSGAFGGFAVCDGVTVNTASVVVIPGGYFTSPPFKKGTALATANGLACSSVVASGGYQACDFGSAGPTTVSIK
ncbi:MAG TPA: hypothetical protein VHW94_03300 [Candidatus Dormibacteraeota bacterium]|nr:hypothetical protein [Candidatus Dormibacteraeota bacterium]